MSNEQSSIREAFNLILTLTAFVTGAVIFFCQLATLCCVETTSSSGLVVLANKTIGLYLSNLARPKSCDPLREL